MVILIKNPGSNPSSGIFFLLYFAGLCNALRKPNVANLKPKYTLLLILGQITSYTL